jgi:hypothetical protein
MHWKGLAILALLPAIAQGSAAVWAQAAANPANGSQAAPANPRPLNPQRPPTATQLYGGAQPYAPHPAAPYSGAQPYPAHPAAPAAGAQGQNHPAAAASPAADSTTPDEPTPQISIATPAPAPAPWPVQERIAWGARVLLALFGCVGIYIGLSLLKKIDRQTQYAESTAQSAAQTAQAALEHAQALVRAERPWILVTVEPSGKAENRFMIVATNRGRGPARILSAVEKITTEIDQSSLPAEPDYDDAEANESLESVILLPGESTGVKTFGRDEVRDFCGSEEKYRRVEKWEEVILLFGKIVYQDLVDTGTGETCETAWCCWYIHGRQNSGMVMAGPPPYNRHT